MHPCILYGVATIAQRTPTRDAILDAADHLMERYGFRRITLDDIARDAGVAKRTIYLHFKNKEDVGLSSIGRVVEQTHVAMMEVANSALPAMERLRVVLRERVLGRVRRVQGYRHSLDELFEAVRPAYLERRRRAFEFEVDLVARLIGEVGVSDPYERARSLVQATNAFLPYSLTVAELGNLDGVERDLDNMIHLLIHGLDGAHRSNLL